MPNQPKPTWQPISQLPLIASLIDETVENSEDQFKTFSEVKDKPHVLDDATVSRAIRLYKAQLEDLWLYEGQTDHWLKQPLTDNQQREIHDAH